MTDLERFVSERSPRWKRLEALLDEAQRMPESALGRSRLQELLLLYRSASADLNQARALTFVGALAMLFYNGVLLGAVAAQYLIDGAGTFFVAWVGPHGALEIPSIVFAGAAGLVAGRALLFPGDEGRPAALRASFPAVLRMLCACAILLVFAGLIEGSFSQMSARAVPHAVKIAVACVLFAAMNAWLFLGRAREAT